MIKPHCVLEVGTFSGYSALCIAEALPPEGVIHTVEINDEHEDFIKEWLSRSPFADKIILHIGDALKTVPDLGLEYDLIFIDGEKTEYPDYYTVLIDFLMPGGYIIADNTLWDGHVTDSNYDSDPQTAAVKRFNDMVAADKRVEVAMIPIRDGLTLIRKLK